MNEKWKGFLDFLQSDIDTWRYRVKAEIKDSMSRTVAQKMGLKEGMRAYFLNAPASALDIIHLPELKISQSLRGEFDYLHLFTTSQADMDNAFPKLASHLKQSGMLWISWPKAKQLNTDLSLPHVIRIGYKHGLVESTTLSVNTIWSAMKFTHPKPGKSYRNSYGKLVRVCGENVHEA